MTVTQSTSSPRRRAPRNTLNPERILDAAVTLLDREGADAFTMRALAQELGVATMAVYSHFRSKEEITDAVAQRLLAEVELPPVCDALPREQLRQVCTSVFRLFTDHPSALQLLTSRPMRGDEAIAAIDRMLGLLREAGLTRADAARAHLALMQYTFGAAVWHDRRRRADCEDGIREHVRARLADLPPERYPSLTGMLPEMAGARDGGVTQYEYGLDGLLDGLIGPGRR